MISWEHYVVAIVGVTAFLTSMTTVILLVKNRQLRNRYHGYSKGTNDEEEAILPPSNQPSNAADSVEDVGETDGAAAVAADSVEDVGETDGAAAIVEESSESEIDLPMPKRHPPGRLRTWWRRKPRKVDPPAGESYEMQSMANQNYLDQLEGSGDRPIVKN